MQKHQHSFKKILFLSLALLVPATATVAASVPAFAAAQDNATIIKQSNVFVGTSTIYLSQDRAKVVARDGNLIITCGPPDYKVLVFRKDENRGWLTALDSWTKSGLGVNRSKVSMRGGVQSKVFDNTLKVDCVQIVVTPGNNNNRFYDGNDPVMFRSTTKSSVKRVIFKMTPAIPLSEKQRSFIQGYFDQSIAQYFPLELRTELSDGAAQKTYSTWSIKKGTVPADFWTLPTNYQSVATRAEIMATQKDLKKFGDILKGYMAEDQEVTAKRAAHAK